MKRAFVGVIALLFSSTAALCSTIYTLDTGSIGTGPFGTITTTVDGANLDVTVSVAPNYDVDTGAHWALTFDLATSGLTITGLSSPFFQATGSSFTNDPFNTSPFNYAIGCTGGGGGQNSCNDATGFSFVIVNGGSLSPILTDGVYFAADVFDIATRKTGVVGASSFLGGGNQDPTPIPATLPLLGSVLGIGYLAYLTRRKRSRPSSFAAVAA
jgi:hypothetical protein